MASRAIDLSIINVSLEYTSFQDFRVRDALSKFIKELGLDLDEVAYEPSEMVKRAIEELETVLTEIDTKGERRKKPRIHLEEVEAEGVVTRRRKVDVDEELAEFTLDSVIDEIDDDDVIEESPINRKK